MDKNFNNDQKYLQRRMIEEHICEEYPQFGDL
jgi:hypothetical protein